MSDNADLTASLRTIDEALRRLDRPIKPNDIVGPGLGAHEARSAFVDVVRHRLVEFTEGTYDGPGKQESEVVIKRLTAKGHELLGTEDTAPTA
ncbi:hypothetical protein AB0I28_23720 [Phytomonospora sp. NPDC050363]|uniref:hypothetical protein n=1 Tax=Phytomonospora sp. NPDC050363 TaxID=3155642 RepID=UPI0033C78800